MASREVIVISKEMTESESELTQSIQRKILRTIALLSAQRLKDRTESHGDSLKKQIDLLQEQVHFGTLFVYMIILFGM
ncbi:MAG: hypothetical protein QF752_17110, partial [Planctomycetota bacterium]|nr:hypothetical protein [Planctomycetota bacterium]